MAIINDDILNQLNELQTPIWSTVSLTVSEAAGQEVKFDSPLMVKSKVSDIHSELSGQLLIIQFAMAMLPENPMVVILRPDLILDFARLTTGIDAQEVDENIISDVRPIAEAIVQGLCLSLGNITMETIVATGLSIRYQNFQCPINMQKAMDLARVQVAVTAEELSGGVLWLLDPESARCILKIPDVEEDEVVATFDRVNDSNKNVVNGGLMGGGRNFGVPEVDSGSLDVLLDVPLEITVELGRVRMLVREILDLGTGSIVEVDKSAGEPVDVMVNGRLVAKGEVVVIEDNLGVRITEIVNPNERFRLDHAS